MQTRYLDLGMVKDGSFKESFMSQIGTYGLLILGRDAWFTRKVLGHANVVEDK